MVIPKLFWAVLQVCKLITIRLFDFVIFVVSLLQNERCGVFGKHLYQLPCSVTENCGAVPKYDHIL